MIKESSQEGLKNFNSGDYLDVFRTAWDEKKLTDNPAEAEAMLKKISSFCRFRQAGRRSSFGEFYSLIENVNLFKEYEFSVDEKEEARKNFLDKVTLSMQGQSPRVSDFYGALLNELEGVESVDQFETTKQMMLSLKESGGLQILTNPLISMDVKLDRMEKEIEGFLKGAKALDRREGRVKDEAEKKEREEKIKNAPTIPPPARDESKPSMDEMERSKEGENPQAIWSIHPAQGGYFKEQSFDTWDNENQKWTQSTYKYSDIQLAETGEPAEKISLQAEILSGQWTRVPVPYTFEIAKINSSNAENYQLKLDQNGDYVIFAQAKNARLVEIEIVLAQAGKSRVSGSADQKNIFKAQLSTETESKIKEIQTRKKGNLARARALSSYVMRRLKYSNDSSYNSIYENHQSGYIGGIDELKQADCDVANTYFAGLCSRLEIPVRHCVGHMVKGKDETGNSRITSGTGHAWSEVWDEEHGKWERVDATPPGDSQFSAEEEKNGNESIPGDYGSQEAKEFTDEELFALEKELAKLVEKLSYTPEERELAEATNIEMKEAREIVKEIEKAENTKLPNGERVVDVLSALFNQIIESRKIATPGYTGPLRKSEGGEEIEDIVTHFIGTSVGQADPNSRQKEVEKEKDEKIFGGFDFYMIGDKSSSMSQTVDGEMKWKTQRLAEFLIFLALHRFDANLKRAGVSPEKNLSVRSRGISFRNSSEIDEDKALSTKFEPKDKVKMWKSLGNQGSGNGDVAALLEIRDQIREEIQQLEKDEKRDDRLRYVVVCSDGYPDDAVKVQQIVKELGKMNAVVVGIGLTETARAVKTIFATQWSRGDVAADINDLPAIVAKHLVFEAIKLFPKKSQQNAQVFIEAILGRFKNIGE